MIFLKITQVLVAFSTTIRLCEPPFLLGLLALKGLTSEKSVKTHPPLGYPESHMGSWSGLPTRLYQEGAARTHLKLDPTALVFVVVYLSIVMTM
jgi:hypothetical protein